MRWSRAALVISILVSSAACDRDKVAKVDKDTAKEAASATEAKLATAKDDSIDDVIAMQKKGGVVLVDCNDKASRVERGVIEGAIILTDAPKLNGQLPSDKGTPLVFYCWDGT